MRVDPARERPVAGDGEMPRRRREAELHRAPRVRRVGGQADEAHQRARDSDPRGERLLRVAHARRVDVARLEHGQIAAEELRRREAREAASVALVRARADGDRELRPVRPAREDRRRRPRRAARASARRTASATRTGGSTRPSRRCGRRAARPRRTAA